MKKVISTLLALSIILGTLFTGMSVAVSAATFTPAVKEEPVSEAQPYPITSYSCISNYDHVSGNNLAKYDKASITKDGVDGSYALKIEGEDKLIESYITLADNFLEKDTEYTLEMKIKRDTNFDEMSIGDEVPFVDFGVALSANWKYRLEPALFAETGVFETFTYTFTLDEEELDENGKPRWCLIYLNYLLPAGSAIYIDDINIYKTGAEDINLFNLKKEERGSNLGSFDWMTTTQVEDETIEGSIYTPNDISSYGISKDYVSIVNGKGVNGSAAMQIGPTNGKKDFYTQFAAEGTKYGGDTTDSFFAGKTVRVAFTAKKVGTVSDFKVMFYKSGSWVQHNMIATELTDDWVRYEVDIKFSTYDMYVHSTKEDGTVVYRGGHNRLVFQSNVAADSYIYIDNIEVYAQADNFTTNGYTKGTFDTFKYAKSPVTETTYEGVTYTPYAMENYKFEWSDNGDTARVPGENNIAISDLGEGVNGSYALEIVGEGAEKQFTLSLGKDTLKPTTEYMVKFKAKVSNSEALTRFLVGISARWQWVGNANIDFTRVVGTAEQGGGSVEIDWYQYTSFISTDANGQGSYRNIWIDYTLATGETLWIDDIEVYEVGGTGENLFSQGSFCRVDSVSAIDSGDEEGYFNYKYIDDWTVDAETNPEGNGFAAAPIATSLALNGKHALAIGFNPENNIIGRVWFELPSIDTGKTYKVKFSVLVVGELTNLRINMKDGMEATVGDIKPTVTLLERTPVFTKTGGDAKLYQYLPAATWQTYEFYFTDQYFDPDLTDNDDAFTWPGMEIYLKGKANSGVLVDDVSIYEVDGTDEDKPNLFPSTGFEREAVADADFTTSTKFWSGSADDMSFMNALPKAIGFYNTSYNDNSDIFDAVTDVNSEFAYSNTMIIDTSSTELAKYEIKHALAANKEIWIGLNNFVSKNNAVIEGYQDKVEYIANLVQNLAGDAFQGFYFDEPHYNFESNEKFAEVTKWLRETYHKRVFAMLKHDSFTSPNAKVTVTEDAFKYVTDVGYWNYSISGMNERIEKFNLVLPYINENARVWIAPLMGTHDGITTEEQTMQIFNAMIAGVKSDDRFGGIMLYSLTDSNGYNLHKLDENGVAEYNNFRNLILAVADEFAGKNILEDVLNEDGVLVVNGTETALDFGNLAVYNNVTVVDGETDLGIDAVLSKTGITVNVECLTSNEVKAIKVAVPNDVNGDGEADIRDLVRMKKLSGAVDAPAEQLAAAGTTKAQGVQAIHLASYRGLLIG